MKAPLADAIRELRAKTSEKPRAAASGSAPPDAPAAPTQQWAAAQPAEAEPPKAEAEPPRAEAEPAKVEASKAEASEAEPVKPEAAGAEPEPAKPEPAGASKPAGQPVTVVPGVPRYHRSDCILIRFMGDNDLQKMPVEAAREAGCSPCRACQPDGARPADPPPGPERRGWGANSVIRQRLFLGWRFRACRGPPSLAWFEVFWHGLAVSGMVRQHRHQRIISTHNAILTPNHAMSGK